MLFGSSVFKWLIVLSRGNRGARYTFNLLTDWADASAILIAAVFTAGGTQMAAQYA
jgi:hypothetical protein